MPVGLQRKIFIHTRYLEIKLIIDAQSLADNVFIIKVSPGGVFRKHDGKWALQGFSGVAGFDFDVKNFEDIGLRQKNFRLVV